MTTEENNQAKKTRKRNIILTVILLVITLYLAYHYFMAVSLFVLAIAMMCIGVWAILVFDKLFIPEYDTWDEIKKGNMAVALAFIGFCGIVAACILAVLGSVYGQFSAIAAP